MLTDKIRIDHPPDHDDDDPENIFASAVGLIFTDDLRNQHGDPGATVVYKSARYGEIKLSVADPSGEDERRLFAHYLWNAGVCMAELISEDGAWSVEGETVIELGAGLGLGGIVSSLAEAKEVVISDYPARVVLENLSSNVQANIPPHRAICHPTIQGHEWGELGDEFSTTHKGHFTRVLSADCLWMPWQHQNLAKSMLHFLSDDPGARVYVLAGFHTGRAKLARFFDVAEEEGLEVDEIEEVDVAGNKRPWAQERDGGREDVTERKRWLVVAKLKRRRGPQT